MAAILRIWNNNSGTLHGAEMSILKGDESGESTELLLHSLFGEGGLQQAIFWSQHMIEQVLDPATVSLSGPAEVGLDDGLQLTTHTATHGKSAKQRGYRRHGPKWGRKGGSKGPPGGGPVPKSQKAGAR